MASGEELAKCQRERQPERRHTLPRLIKVSGRSPGIATGLSLLAMTEVGSAVKLMVVVAALAMAMTVTVVAMRAAILFRQRQSFHAGDTEVILLQINGQSWGEKSKGAQVGLSLADGDNPDVPAQTSITAKEPG